jgi:hypothetical protein
MRNDRIVGALAATAAAVAVSVLGTSAAYGAGATVTNVEFTDTVNNCPPGEPFLEIVELSGTLHEVTHTFIDPQGVLHGNVKLSYSNFTGTGLTTGDTYRFTSASGGAFQFDLVEGSFSGTRSITQVLSLPGHGMQYIFHDNFHVTLSSDGVEVVRENSFLECRSA